MSRIGKKPVAVPKGVKIEQHGQTVKITGPLGSAELTYDPCLTVKIEDSGSRIDVVNPEPEVRRNKELHGTTRALLANMIVGVTQGYQKKMEIYGTGYNVTAAQVALNWLINANGDTVVTIPGVTRVSQAVESAGAMKFNLTADEISKLDEISRNIQ